MDELNSDDEFPHVGMEGDQEVWGNRRDLEQAQFGDLFIGMGPRDDNGFYQSDKEILIEAEQSGPIIVTDDEDNMEHEEEDNYVKSHFSCIQALQMKKVLPKTMIFKRNHQASKKFPRTIC